MDSDADRLAPLLDRMVDYERSRPLRREWDLSTVARLLHRKGAAVARRPAVQIAGSKGKGTTAAFIEALLAASGQSVGSYSSPHVTTLRERIRIAGELVELDYLEAVLSSLLTAAGEEPPTFFEAMTVAAVECFAQAGVDFSIYEAGLGGRYDATTAIDVDAAVVTHIELEHTDVLGNTIEAIAKEKAPVIRANGLGLTATTGVALQTVREHADRVDAELLVLGEHFGLRDVSWSPAGAGGELWLPSGESRNFFLPDAKGFTLPAFALAAATISRLLPGLSLCLDPVPSLSLPCRFEVREEPDGDVLILDGAHTEDSMRAVVEELDRRYPNTRPSALVAIASGKRWQQGLSVLLPSVDSFVVTALTGMPGVDPATMLAWLVEHGAQGEVAMDVASGLRKLREHQGPRLVVGSFYLAGAVRELVASPS